MLYEGLWGDSFGECKGYICTTNTCLQVKMRSIDYDLCIPGGRKQIHWYARLGKGVIASLPDGLYLQQLVRIIKLSKEPILSMIVDLVGNHES